MQRRAVDHAQETGGEQPMEEPALQTLSGTRAAVPNERFAVDASAHRLELLNKFGNDIVAMGVDAAVSIKANDSMESMLAHQLARIHKAVMEVTGKAWLEQDTVEQARLYNVAARLSQTYQSGLQTLDKLRRGPQQIVVMKEVTVGAGGQAIVGNVNGRAT